MKNINDYILLVPNIVPNELSNAVLSEYKECENWTSANIASGPNLNVRNCQTIGISFDGIIERNREIRQKIDQELFACAANAIQKYNEQFTRCRIEQDSGYELLKYGEGSFYVTHTDSFKDHPRAVSCSFALNDDYEGGEFAFFDRELVYNLKKGSCIMFPSNFMYPHEVMPVTSGTRYSIITWFI